MIRSKIFGAKGRRPFNCGWSLLQSSFNFKIKKDVLGSSLMDAAAFLDTDKKETKAMT